MLVQRPRPLDFDAEDKIFKLSLNLIELIERCSLFSSKMPRPMSLCLVVLTVNEISLASPTTAQLPPSSSLSPPPPPPRSFQIDPSHQIRSNCQLRGVSLCIRGTRSIISRTYYAAVAGGGGGVLVIRVLYEFAVLVVMVCAHSVC